MQRDHVSTHMHTQHHLNLVLWPSWRAEFHFLQCLEMYFSLKPGYSFVQTVTLIQVYSSTDFFFIKQKKKQVVDILAAVNWPQRFTRITKGRPNMYRHACSRTYRDRWGRLGGSGCSAWPSSQRFIERWSAFGRAREKVCRIDEKSWVEIPADQWNSLHAPPVSGWM